MKRKRYLCNTFSDITLTLQGKLCAHVQNVCKYLPMMKVVPCLANIIITML